ncbi:MAG TPA: hypothetical protein VHP33_07305 [Polyangiaceae bacterium]|nr:hypothetical protein [Polyangiaceae bacterium]
MTGWSTRIAVVLVGLASFGAVAAARYERQPTTRYALVEAALSRALSQVPVEHRPAALRLDGQNPARAASVEFDFASGALLLGPGAEDLPSSVWLHELGHARMRGARPHGVLGGRLFRAIDEGAADYFAACVSGSPRLGDARELRDLTAPPPVTPSEWATLALPSGFDAHRMGWALAARLYAAEPRRGPLLDALVACLDGESGLASAADTPAATIQALLQACPASARDRISNVLADWLPTALSNPESPP